MRALTAFLSALVLCSVAASEWTNSTPDTAGIEVAYSNSVRFLFDTDGKQIDAYGAKVNRKLSLATYIFRSANEMKYSVS
jgi:hypothetical protein